MKKFIISLVLLSITMNGIAQFPVNKEYCCEYKEWGGHNHWIFYVKAINKDTINLLSYYQDDVKGLKVGKLTQLHQKNANLYVGNEKSYYEHHKPVNITIRKQDKDWEIYQYDLNKWVTLVEYDNNPKMRGNINWSYWNTRNNELIFRLVHGNIWRPLKIPISILKIFKFQINCPDTSQSHHDFVQAVDEDIKKNYNAYYNTFMERYSDFSDSLITIKLQRKQKGLLFSNYSDVYEIKDKVGLYHILNNALSTNQPEPSNIEYRIKIEMLDVDMNKHSLVKNYHYKYYLYVKNNIFFREFDNENKYYFKLDFNLEDYLLKK